MSKSVRRSRRKELSTRGNEIPPDTILGADSDRILLSQTGLIELSNAVSKKIGRKCTEGEVQGIHNFLGRQAPSKYQGVAFGDAITRLADEFVNRYNVARSVMEEDQDLLNIVDLDPHEGTGLHDVQRAELEGLTTNESPLKYGMYHDRRGNSIVDRDRAGEERIMRDRSTPNNVLSSEGYDRRYATADEQGSGAMTEAMMRNQVRLQKDLARYAKALNQNLNPEKITEIFERSRSSWITFANVTLPHQIVPLDSRFRNVSYNEPGEIQWNIHSTGDPGRPGDVRMLDTVKEIMVLKISPMWIPVVNNRNQYFDKVRMFIKEFKGQSVQVPEFIDCDQGCVARPHHYHFEFNVERVGSNRLYLTPVEPTFIFRKPMAQMNTITAEFRAPFEKIIFDDDRLTFDITHTNPAVFTSVDGSPHNLSTGDLVYVCNFASGTTAENNAVNRQGGHTITRLGSTSFSINVDLSGIAGGPTENIEVQFGSKRIIGQMELLSLEQ